MKISELFKLPGNDVTKNFGYKLFFENKPVAILQPQHIIVISN